MSLLERKELEEYIDNSTKEDLEVALRVGLNQDHSVLDLGCGMGRHSIELIAKGLRRIVGVDVDQLSLNEAAKKSKESDIKGNLSFLRSSWFALPFLDHKFDFVLLLHSGIDNLSSPEKMITLLREVCRMLKPAGKVLFDVNNGDEIIKAHTNSEDGQIIRRVLDHPYFEEDKMLIWRHNTWIDHEGQMKFSRDEIIEDGIVTQSLNQFPSRFLTTQQYREVLAMAGLKLTQTLPFPAGYFEGDFNSFILAER